MFRDGGEQSFATERCSDEASQGSHLRRRVARPLRLEAVGYWFHVTGRGNARGKIFADDGDRRRFVELLSEFEARRGLEVVCYILMSNHYPVVVDGPPDLDERPFGRGARQSVLLALPGPCRLRIEQKSVHGLVSIERPLNLYPTI